jgi:hypothetical protein
VSLKVEQKLLNLNNREEIDGEKKLNRASGTCGTITTDLIFMPVVFQKEDKQSRPEKIFKEIMTEEFPNLAKSKPTDLRN